MVPISRSPNILVHGSRVQGWKLLRQSFDWEESLRGRTPSKSNMARGVKTLDSNLDPFTLWWRTLNLDKTNGSWEVPYLVVMLIPIAKKHPSSEHRTVSPLFPLERCVN